MWRFAINLLFTALVAIATLPVKAYSGPTDFHTRFYGTIDGLPSDEIQQVFRDSDGFVWFITRSGLVRYDGRSTKVFKSDIRSGDVITNNNVSCITEDSDNRLWIGTNDGLNVYDKTRDSMTMIMHPSLRNNPVSAILSTSAGRLLVGTDQGLYEYHKATDSLQLITREMTGDVMPQTSVKALLEDSRGHIWIGTWSEGLYRIDTAGNYYLYPKTNSHESVHTIFEDSYHRLWIGSWGNGLFQLHNPYDIDKTTWINFRHTPDDPGSIADNIIYSIAEEPSARSIWIGTPRGVSILTDDSGVFTNIDRFDKDNPVREVTSFFSDRQGILWGSMLGNGAFSVVKSNTNLKKLDLEPVRRLLSVLSIYAIEVDSRGRLWLSPGRNMGMIIYDPRTETVTKPSLKDISPDALQPYTVNCFFQLHDRRMLVGTYDYGLFFIDESGRVLDHWLREENPRLAGNRVNTIFEDRNGRVWIGCSPGLSVINPDGTYCNFNDLYEEQINARRIVQGNNGSIWIATRNMGILRIDGEGSRPSDFNVHRYAPGGESLYSVPMQTVYCDSQGRIWAGGQGMGLSLYHYNTDTFEPLHLKWNLPGVEVSNIHESHDRKSLWISTDMGLLDLQLPENSDSLVSYHLYTPADGAQDYIFNKNTVSVNEDGTMYFGGPRGINIIEPVGSYEDKYTVSPRITDFRIGGISWHQLPPEERYSVSPLAPGYTDAVTLRYDQNNISIDFNVFDFLNNPFQHKYEYRLEGFDRDWQRTDASSRMAHYNNLPPGSYKFHVRSSDSSGQWIASALPLGITIKPPLWATWWAYAIYTLLLIALLVTAFIISRRRMHQRNLFHLRELEMAQAEELNKAKLRFFTNVTHEWLTPLSIISAVTEEMDAESPREKEHCRILSNSVERLSRLLQQVLEFRKAESGNLKLKVSEGDLVYCVQKIADTFAPVMKSRDIKFSFTSSVESLICWFDPDKLDKILYNLLSNASKYILPGDTTDVRLTAGDRRVVITISDNGPGIPADRLPDLFKRFYEGEYRQFNTSGNGIGLSLTKDLVDLHHGTITVDSVEGRGTTFIVELPVSRDAFSDTETEPDSALRTSASALPSPDLEEDFEGEPQPPGTMPVILIVEDDMELLDLTASMLAHDYKVITASSCSRAYELLPDYDIDLIISDIMMEGMDGVQFCKEVKNRIEYCHIPILLLTANSMEEAEIDAYKAGADGFMAKPFNFKVLNARISNLLRARRSATRTFLRNLGSDEPLPEYSNLDEDFLRRAINCITDHIAEADYSQTMFSHEMGLSKSTLFRKLKSLTGLSYSAFVRTIRLKAACRMMRENRSIRISELAYAVGFNNPKYFSVCFKREFGMQPTEYIDHLDPPKL